MPTEKIPQLEQTGLQLSRKIIRCARDWIAMTDIARFLGMKSMQEISTTNPSALLKSLQPIYQGMCKDFRILELSEENWGAREAVRQCLLNDKAGKTKRKEGSRVAKPSRSDKFQPFSTKKRAVTQGKDRKQSKADVLLRNRIKRSKKKGPSSLKSREAAFRKAKKNEFFGDESFIRSSEQVDHEETDEKRDQEKLRRPSNGRISKKSLNQRKKHDKPFSQNTADLNTGTCSSVEDNETLQPSDESDGEQEKADSKRTKLNPSLVVEEMDSCNSDDNICLMRIKTSSESNGHLDGSESSKNGSSTARSESDVEDDDFNSEDEAFALRILKAGNCAF